MRSVQGDRHSVKSQDLATPDDAVDQSQVERRGGVSSEVAEGDGACLSRVPDSLCQTQIPISAKPFQAGEVVTGRGWDTASRTVATLFVVSGNF